MKRSSQSVRVSELNPHLMCVLCGGYYVDATTIIECLHSFCKTCIVNYLDSSKFCPICDVQVHKTKPLMNIRPDNALQELVYKLVPGLFTREIINRQKFYRKNPDAIETSCDEGPSAEASDEPEPNADSVVGEDRLSVSLEFSTDGKAIQRRKSKGKGKNAKKTETILQKRYLLCPSAFTIGHVKKFIRMKFDLSPSLEVDVFHVDEPLSDSYALLDIAYLYMWNKNEPFPLFFSVYTNTVKRQKVVARIKEIPVEPEVKAEKRDDLTPPEKESAPKPSRKGSKNSRSPRHHDETKRSSKSSHLNEESKASKSPDRCEEINESKSPRQPEEPKSSPVSKPVKRKLDSELSAVDIYAKADPVKPPQKETECVNPGPRRDDKACKDEAKSRSVELFTELTDGQSNGCKISTSGSGKSIVVSIPKHLIETSGSEKEKRKKKHHKHHRKHRHSRDDKEGSKSKKRRESYEHAKSDNCSSVSNSPASDSGELLNSHAACDTAIKCSEPGVVITSEDTELPSAENIQDSGLNKAETTNIEIISSKSAENATIPTESKPSCDNVLDTVKKVNGHVKSERPSDFSTIDQNDNGNSKPVTQREPVLQQLQSEWNETQQKANSSIGRQSNAPEGKCDDPKMSGTPPKPHNTNRGIVKNDGAAKGDSPKSNMHVSPQQNVNAVQIKKSHAKPKPNQQGTSINKESSQPKLHQDGGISTKKELPKPKASNQEGGCAKKDSPKAKSSPLESCEDGSLTKKELLKSSPQGGNPTNKELSNGNSPQKKKSGKDEASNVDEKKIKHTQKPSEERRGLDKKDGKLSGISQEKTPPHKTTITGKKLAASPPSKYKHQSQVLTTKPKPEYGPAGCPSNLQTQKPATKHHHYKPSVSASSPIKPAVQPSSVPKQSKSAKDIPTDKKGNLASNKNVIKHRSPETKVVRFQKKTESSLRMMDAQTPAPPNSSTTTTVPVSRSNHPDSSPGTRRPPSSPMMSSPQTAMHHDRPDTLNVPMPWRSLSSLAEAGRKVQESANNALGRTSPCVPATQMFSPSWCEDMRNSNGVRSPTRLSMDQSGLGSPTFPDPLSTFESPALPKGIKTYSKKEKVVYKSPPTFGQVGYENAFRNFLSRPTSNEDFLISRKLSEHNTYTGSSLLSSHRKDRLTPSVPNVQRHIHGHKVIGQLNMVYETIQKPSYSEVHRKIPKSGSPNKPISFDKSIDSNQKKISVNQSHSNVKDMSKGQDSGDHSVKNKITMPCNSGPSGSQCKSPAFLNEDHSPPSQVHSSEKVSRISGDAVASDQRNTQIETDPSNRCDAKKKKVPTATLR